MLPKMSMLGLWNDACRGMHLSLDEVDIPAADDFTKKLTASETYKLLRREITYLSKTQREIIVRHYFKKQKLDEISLEMGIPLGSVKWHLYDAKNSLKEGMSIVRSTGSLGLQPIKFCNMGHRGYCGSLGDTGDFLKKRLTQNVAYAAYREPKTVNEIAEELGVSPVFVEDEVACLEEYGFMDKLAGGKYLTNIFITRPTKEVSEKENEIYTRYADTVCKQYVSRLIESLKEYDKNELYVPGNDFNLLLWAAIPYAIGHKLHVDQEMHSDEFSVRRKDGGDFIAVATVDTDFQLSYDEKKYQACGDMTRCSDKYPIFSWQQNTCFDGRTGGWRDNIYTDYEYLYEFINGTLTKEAVQIEKYKRLYDKGYLIDKSGKDTVNIIVVKSAGGKESPNYFYDLLPSITEDLKTIGNEFYQEILELEIGLYPAHMQKLCRAMLSNRLSGNIIRVLEILLKNGVLTLPNNDQKRGMNTVLFSDILPR